MKAFLFILVPVLYLGVYFGGSAVFEYPLSGVDLLTSFGEVNGVGIGFESGNSKFGFILWKDVEAFSILRSREKLLIFENENVWFLSTGKYMENFNLNTLALKKTPPLARIAVRMAVLPRCKEGDSECLKRRKETSDILNTLFESSLFLRRISRIGSGYSLLSINIKDIPKIGFMSHDGGYYFGFSKTDGTNAFVLGFGWKEGLSTGLGISTKIGKFRTDFLMSIGDFGIDASIGLEMNFGKEGKGFVLLSKDGVRLYLF